MSQQADAQVPSASAPVPWVQLSSVELYCVAALSVVQGAVFGWGAWALPWAHASTFTLASAALAASHVALAATCLLWPRHAARAWRINSGLSLAWLGLISWHVFTGGAYLAGLYGSLGEGLFAALLAIWGLAVLFSVPTSVWGLVRTRVASRSALRLPTALLLGVVLLIGVRSGWLCHVAYGAPLTEAEQRTSARTQLLRLKDNVSPEPPNGAPKLGKPRPFECPRPPTSSAVTLVVTFASVEAKQYESHCLQADDLSVAVDAAKALLERERATLPVFLDSIHSAATLGHGPAWVSAFELRPGLDGVCVAARCLLPWQLLAGDAFLENRPLDFIGDLKFGASLSELSERLRARDEHDSEEQAEPARITTQSWLLNARGLHALERLRPLEPGASPTAGTQALPAALLDAATRSAEEHIVRAQLEDGKFRYMLHPFTGRTQTKNFNLPRQAGTALVLCELGKGPEVTTTIERALELLIEHERTAHGGRVSGLTYKKQAPRLALEESALALVALLECRKRVGPKFDTSIARLSELVLTAQRPDGGFHPAVKRDSAAAVPGKEPLYAPGQAILGLVLLETELEEARLPFQVRAPATLPELDRVREARLAAMEFVAHEHWPASLYPYFFVEENWHCLAARAALARARHRQYEQFCLDYVSFRSRVILDEQSRVDPQFIGGMGFGNVIPPHNTGAAGFGEALSAALHVRKANELSLDQEQATLRRVLSFLLRQQWTPDNCFGCVRDALGAISEHTHSPVTRIDFVQHAWAALGHGSVALAL